MPKDNFGGINEQMSFENDECSCQTAHFSLFVLPDMSDLSLSPSVSHTHKHYVSINQSSCWLALLHHLKSLPGLRFTVAYYLSFVFSSKSTEFPMWLGRKRLLHQKWVADSCYLEKCSSL